MQCIPVSRKQPPIALKLEQKASETDEEFAARITAMEAQCLCTRYAYHIEYAGANRSGYISRTIDHVQVP